MHIECLKKEFFFFEKHFISPQLFYLYIRLQLFTQYQPTTLHYKSYGENSFDDHKKSSTVKRFFKEVFRF